MSETSEGKVAVVTGGNSGLGFEAAALLADKGFSEVIISSRSAEKAAAALAALAERTGKDVFSYVVMDNGDLGEVDEAAETLADRGVNIDFLLLNAGLVPSSLQTTEQGIESTIASTLIGHHRLTMRLLETESLAANARIVIAGSEAARGDVPTMTPLDLEEFAATYFDGDLEAAIERQMIMKSPARFNASDTYATAKVFVAWWAADLARKLPAGMAVNAVSPGSTPGTNAVRDAPFFLKYVMIPVMKIVPGMSHSVADGAGRYLEVESYDDAVSGKFFASKPKKMTGSLVEIRMDHFENRAAQEALWATTTKLAGGVDYPVPA
jgi:NAD(P)-dependent dehydrogenase (short-subunit alcohol dehydrogenase family)